MRRIANDTSVQQRTPSSGNSFQGFMYKAPVRCSKWTGRIRRRYIVLQADKLMWLPDSLPGTEPLGTFDLDASFTVEHLGSVLTVIDSLGQRLVLYECDSGDASAWARALTEIQERRMGATQQVSEASSNRPLLSAAQCTSSAHVSLLALKSEAGEGDWARYAESFNSTRAAYRRSPLEFLRACKFYADFSIVLSSPMLSLHEVVALPNYQLTKWALAGEANVPHAKTITLSDLGVPRHISRHFFSAADPTVLTYGKPTTRFLMLAPSLMQLMIIGSILAEELRAVTNAENLRARLCPMQSGVGETLAATLLYLFALRGMLESSREWLIIGFITSLRDKGRANDALALAGILDETCQLLLCLTLLLLFVGTSSLMELSFNCVALIFIMEIDNLIIKGTFSQNMASHELRRLTTDVTTTDMFLYSVVPPDVWSPFGVHYPSCSVTTRRLHNLFYRWIRPINFALIPFLAPCYVFVCKLEVWPAFAEWVIYYSQQRNGTGTGSP